MQTEKIKSLKGKRAGELKRWALLIEEVVKDYSKLTNAEKSVFIGRAKQLTSELISLTAEITAETMHAQFSKAIEENIERNLLTKMKENGIVEK